MSDTAPAASEAEVSAPVEQPEQEAPAQEVDWKSEARKWEQRSKENKSALDDLTGKFAAIESEKGELAKKVETFTAKEARTEILNAVADATGVPANLLRGETKEDLEAHAEVLKPLIKPSGPIIPGQERTPGSIPDSPEREAARKLFGN